MAANGRLSAAAAPGVPRSRRRRRRRFTRFGCSGERGDVGLPHLEQPEATFAALDRYLSAHLDLVRAP